MEIALYKLSDFEKSLQEIFMKLSEKTAENKIKSLPPYIKYISDGKHLDFAFPPHIESREYATLLLKKIYLSFNNYSRMMYNSKVKIGEIMVSFEFIF